MEFRAQAFAGDLLTLMAVVLGVPLVILAIGTPLAALVSGVVWLLSR